MVVVFELKIMTNNKQTFKTNPLLLFVFLLLKGQFALAQPSEPMISRSQYIEMWKDEAINQMIKHGVPASITLAQGILESGNGNSELARYANNHFGIKCHGWDGPGLYKDDDQPNECFRKYSSANESFEDHSNFLKNKSRYDFLFDLEITDYKGWAKGLKKAGYATNPKYPDLLIKLIEENDLSKYDNLTLTSNNSSTKQNNQLVSYSSNAKSIHQVMMHANNIRYVIVKEGDTFYKIAKEFEMGLWQLYRYNDLYTNDFIRPGDIVFIQPKRRKAKEKYYTVKSGETIKSISQELGVKAKSICKKNDLEINAELTPGMRLKMR